MPERTVSLSAPGGYYGSTLAYGKHLPRTSSSEKIERQLLPIRSRGVTKMSNKKEPRSRIAGRDSRTGQFIPVQETKWRPDTTERERVPLPGFGVSGRYDSNKKR